MLTIIASTSEDRVGIKHVITIGARRVGLAGCTVCLPYSPGDQCVTLGCGGQSHPGDPPLSSPKTHCFKGLHCPRLLTVPSQWAVLPGGQGECARVWTPYFPTAGPRGRDCCPLLKAAAPSRRFSPLPPTLACVLALEPASSLVPSALERKVPSCSQLRAPHHLLGASLHPVFSFVKTPLASFFKPPNKSIPSASCQDTPYCMRPVGALSGNSLGAQR